MKIDARTMLKPAATAAASQFGALALSAALALSPLSPMTALPAFAESKRVIGEVSAAREPVPESHRTFFHLCLLLA